MPGRKTLTALGQRPPRLSLGGKVRRAPPLGVRALLGHWARIYGVDPRLVRALAWMESGYQPGSSRRPARAA